MTLPNKILSALEGGQALSSREIAELLGLSWSTVKRHLDVLMEAGKIQREREGRTARYRLVRASVTRLQSTVSYTHLTLPTICSV